MRVVVVEWLLVTSRAVVYNTDTAYVTAVEPERSSGRHSDGRINVGQFSCGFNHQLFPLGAPANSSHKEGSQPLKYLQNNMQVIVITD